MKKYEKAIISASSRKSISKSTVDFMLQTEKDGFETVYNETKLSNDHLHTIEYLKE